MEFREGNSRKAKRVGVPKEERGNGERKEGGTAERKAQFRNGERRAAERGREPKCKRQPGNSGE